MSALAPRHFQHVKLVADHIAPCDEECIREGGYFVIGPKCSDRLLLHDT